jgi:L-alanine-DL-glutamate epimerase-like enolase superfamily enzyme
MIHARIESVEAQAYTIPTDRPEADGTASWTSTTIVVVQVQAGGRSGLGYTYSDASVATLINTKLAPILAERDASSPQEIWRAMYVAVRNLGRPGLASTAIAAIDAAVWDLKAVLLDQPLAALLGCYRRTVPIYGSGGFTTYDHHELADQLHRWVEKDGCRQVKMKVGSNPESDPARVAIARRAIGDAGLFVDANGAYSARQAQHLAKVFAHDSGVIWFEEPVSSDNLTGLHQIRQHTPAPMEIAAGEYGYVIDDFRRMLDAEAVDVLQADATRCGGVTGFLLVAALCEAQHTDLSAHCAPALHRHLGCAAPRFRHVEWFHDHVRIETMLFDGAPSVHDGTIAPDWSRPGLGLSLKRQEAEEWAS